MKVVVDLHGGRPAAGSDALDFFHREDSIWCDAFVTNAQPLLAMLEKFVAATQHAADVGADLHVEFAGGFRPQQGVITEHAQNVALLDADACGDLGNHRRGEVADFILSAERRSVYCVTSLSKRAASSGEKIVVVSVANAYSSSKTFAVNASAATSNSSLPRRSLSPTWLSSPILNSPCSSTRSESGSSSYMVQLPSPIAGSYSSARI